MLFHYAHDQLMRVAKLGVPTVDPISVNPHGLDKSVRIAETIGPGWLDLLWPCFIKLCAITPVC
jgi:hypothetical protein